MKILVAMTGASGAIYGIRLLQFLNRTEHEVELILSPWAEETIKLETDYKPDEILSLAKKTYDYQDLTASVASGSYMVDATVVVPCSMKTLAAIAHGYTENLITRASDVALKERRTLILVPRETPLNNIHLENMKKASAAGAVILPPMPAFYHKPKSVDEIINQTVGKILDILNIPHNLFRRWTE